MSHNAHVKSLEQLSSFLEKTAGFRIQLMRELDDLELEFKKVSKWVEAEAPTYWSHELRRAERHLTDCRDALVRCQSHVREDERRPCTLEKKRVRLAEERREVCETKLKLSRAAAAAWERDLVKNRTKLGRCRDLVESELQVAVHYLQDQLATLEHYANLKSPANDRQLVGRQSSGTDSPEAPPACESAPKSDAEQDS